MVIRTFVLFIYSFTFKISIQLCPDPVRRKNKKSPMPQLLLQHKTLHCFFSTKTVFLIFRSSDYSYANMIVFKVFHNIIIISAGDRYYEPGYIFCQKTGGLFK